MSMFDALSQREESTAEVICQSQGEHEVKSQWSAAMHECRYEALWPLHLLWRQYVGGILSTSGFTEASAFQLDLHGCHLTVIQHPTAQLVGLEGIAVKASERNVHVVTKDDRHAVVPRSHGSELQFRVSNDHVVSLLH